MNEQTIEWLRSQVLDDEAEPDAPENFWACGDFASRANLDAYFSRLVVSPVLVQGDPSETFYKVPCFDVHDSHGQHLGRWQMGHLERIIAGLLELQRIVPGGATYVMLNSDAVIRQWQLNVKHFSSRARGQRINDLPMFADGKKADGGKAELTAGLLDELLGE